MNHIGKIAACHTLLCIFSQSNGDVSHLLLFIVICCCFILPFFMDECDHLFLSEISYKLILWTIIWLSYYNIIYVALIGQLLQCHTPQCFSPRKMAPHKSCYHFCHFCCLYLAYLHEWVRPLVLIGDFIGSTLLIDRITLFKYMCYWEIVSFFDYTIQLSYSIHFL